MVAPLGGHGIFTDYGLEQSETLANVPYKLMLTAARGDSLHIFDHPAIGHPAVAEAIDSTPELAGFLPRARAAQRACARQRFHAPYIASLPVETPPALAKFRADFKGSELERHVVRRERVDAIAAAAVEQAAGAAWRDQLPWALAMVRSRATQIASDARRDPRWCPSGLNPTGDGVQFCPALTPLLDLCNHAFDDDGAPVSTDSEAMRDSYHWRSIRRIPAGGEVTWSYGPKSNWRSSFRTASPSTATRSTPSRSARTCRR